MRVTGIILVGVDGIRSGQAGGIRSVRADVDKDGGTRSVSIGEMKSISVCRISPISVSWINCRCERMP